MSQRDDLSAIGTTGELASPPQLSVLTSGKLHTKYFFAIALASLVVSCALAALGTQSAHYPWAGALIGGAALYIIVSYVVSFATEGRRKAQDRLVTALVITIFMAAVTPLVSVLWTVISRGVARMDVEFFTSSMRGVVFLGTQGGLLHALLGSLLITGAAIIISVPIALACAVYLSEYGNGRFAKVVTMLVDVMTGIPSIVAGLFAYAVFSLIFGPGVRSGFAGAIALSLLMIPVVIRSAEEMIRLVPDELREASYALGIPKYRTILSIVLPTAMGGIVSGIMIAIARIVGETAPLLLVAGFTDSMNYNLFSDRMASLPVYIYTQWQNKGVDAAAYDERAWSAALVLIVLIMIFNAISRLFVHFFGAKNAKDR